MLFVAEKPRQEFFQLVGVLIVERIGLGLNITGVRSADERPHRHVSHRLIEDPESRLRSRRIKIKLLASLLKDRVIAIHGADVSLPLTYDQSNVAEGLPLIVNKMGDEPCLSRRIPILDP